MAPMKALTLHQPWASAIALGLKTIETRSWPTSHRGRIAIHAGAALPKYAKDFMSEAPAVAQPVIQLLMATGLPLGRVVATADLYACIPAHKALMRLKQMGQVETETDTPNFHVNHCGFHRANEFLGNYDDKDGQRWAWLLRDIRPLAHPIVIRGGQRLWTWQEPEELLDHPLLPFVAPQPGRGHNCS